MQYHDWKTSWDILRGLDSKKFHFFSKANLALVIKNRLSIMTGNHYYLGYTFIVCCNYRKEKFNSMSKTKIDFSTMFKNCRKVSHTIFCVIKNANFSPLWPISYLLESNGKLVFILRLKENRKLGSDNEWNEQKNF